MAKKELHAHACSIYIQQSVHNTPYHCDSLLSDPVVMTIVFAPCERKNLTEKLVLVRIQCSFNVADVANNRIYFLVINACSPRLLSSFRKTTQLQRRRWRPSRSSLRRTTNAHPGADGCRISSLSDPFGADYSNTTNFKCFFARVGCGEVGDSALPALCAHFAGVCAQKSACSPSANAFAPQRQRPLCHWYCRVGNFSSCVQNAHTFRFWPRRRRCLSSAVGLR